MIVIGFALLATIITLRSQAPAMTKRLKVVFGLGFVSSVIYEILSLYYRRLSMDDAATQHTLLQISLFRFFVGGFVVGLFIAAAILTNFFRSFYQSEVSPKKELTHQTASDIEAEVKKTEETPRH